MTYCPSCRVTLADTCTQCPLCGGPCVASDDPVPDFQAVRNGDPEVIRYPTVVMNADQREKLTLEEQRLVVVELLSVSIGMILILTTGIDILLSRTLTWSKYTSLILCLVWLVCAIPLLLWGKPWSVFSVLAPALPGGILLLAVFSGNLGWFLMPALPIILLVEAVVLASFVVIAREKQKGLNCVGVVLAASAVVCVGVDVIVNRFLTGSIGLQWSVIVLISLIPVTGLFFYLHYRVINKASLRKLFRL